MTLNVQNPVNQTQSNPKTIKPVKKNIPTPVYTCQSLKTYEEKIKDPESKIEANSLKDRLIKRLTKEKVKATICQIKQILNKADQKESWVGEIEKQIEDLVSGDPNSFQSVGEKLIETEKAVSKLNLKSDLVKEVLDLLRQPIHFPEKVQKRGKGRPPINLDELEVALQNKLEKKVEKQEENRQKRKTEDKLKAREVVKKANNLANSA